MYNYICFLPISSGSVGVLDIVGLYTLLVLGFPILLLGLPILLLGLHPSMFTKYKRFISQMMRSALN